MTFGKFFKFLFGGLGGLVGTAITLKAVMVWRLFSYIVFFGGILYPIGYTIVHWEALLLRDPSAVMWALVPLATIFYYLRKHKQDNPCEDEVYSKFTHVIGYYVAAMSGIAGTLIILFATGKL